ncbi:MAG TPA: DUF4192 domain-containing protein, partial [Candidatus Tumulicola sp.]|nr:DUF4192 domain-containing protein [Candidatus Tumulicola sp.]
MLAGMSTHPATAHTSPLKLRTPVDIVDAVPHLVGFQPENSLVCMSLRGPRKRLGVVSRADLPPVRFARPFATQTARYLKHDGAEHVILVFYPPDDGPKNGRLIALITALEKALDKQRINVIEVLCVYDGRWWSLLCDDDDCCPPDGTAIDQQRTSLVAAEMAASGRVVFKSRAELERTLEPVRGAAARDMRAELSRARSDVHGRTAAGGAAEVAAESIKLYEDAVRRRQQVAETMTSIGSDDAARLIVALDDVAVRDQILTWAEGDRGEALQRLLAELAPRALEGHEAPVLTAYALTCYVQGEGALAGIALDRARQADPTYNLARILDDALLGCVNPAVLRD